MMVERAIAQAKEHRRMRTLPIDGETLEMLEDYIRRGGPVTRNGTELIFGIKRHSGGCNVSPGGA
jgi:integrase/recombinase XerD